MWGTLASLAGTLGLYDVMNQLNRTVDPNKVSQLASSIINEAEKRGAEELRKAEMVISNIPSIAGSPAIQSSLRRKRKEAINNYNNVERNVSNMKAEAQQKADKISDINNKGMVDKLINGKGYVEQAEKDAKDAVSAVNNYDYNKVEEKI